MKTATINVHHVFGTKSTEYAEVMYRGKRQHFLMEDRSAQVLCNEVCDWARAKGYTHFKINFQ